MGGTICKPGNEGDMSVAALADAVAGQNSLGCRFARGTQRADEQRAAVTDLCGRRRRSDAFQVTQPAATLATTPVATGAGMR
jgi:hypothetical protein